MFSLNRPYVGLDHLGPAQEIRRPKTKLWGGAPRIFRIKQEWKKCFFELQTRMKTFQKKEMNENISKERDVLEIELQTLQVDWNHLTAELTKIILS